MSGLLDRVFGSSGAAASNVTYDESKVLAADTDGENRRALAARGDVKPEVLYYLAADELSAVRREIAANEKTPRQADRLLAEDVDDEVRCDLARKIGRIAPNLSQEAQDQVQTSRDRISLMRRPVFRSTIAINRSRQLGRASRNRSYSL